ncbi:hypothetical protein FACS1894211_03780 [Clostridia bacterium]|nr:hypothetical protein FACS1894211_03780 [Clostridia bacterium]
MFLHIDKDEFTRIIGEIVNTREADEAIIEKDYFVTMFLKGLVAREPNIIFKGGTSLSKCYHVL